MIGSIINGQERNTSENIMDVINPFNKEKVEEIALASRDDLEDAITNSFDTFHNTMKSMTAHERSDILRKTADLMEENTEEFCASDC